MNIPIRQVGPSGNVPASSGGYDTGYSLGAPSRAMGQTLGNIAESATRLGSDIAYTRDKEAARVAQEQAKKREKELENDEKLALAHAEATITEDQSKSIHDWSNMPYADDYGLPKQLNDQAVEDIIDANYQQMKEKTKGLSEQNQQALDLAWQQRRPGYKEQFWGLQTKKRQSYLDNVVLPKIASMGYNGMEIPATLYAERVIPLFPENSHFDVRQSLETAYFQGTLKARGSDAARQILTSNPDHFTTEVLDELNKAADKKEQEEYAQFMSESSELAITLSVGDTQKGIPPQPQKAVDFIHKTAKGFKTEDRGPYIRSSMNKVAEAKLNEDANDALVHLYKYKSDYDQGDWATHVNRAVSAIEKEGGSTDVRRRKASSDLFAKMVDPLSFSKAYTDSASLLTPQQRSQTMRAFSKRGIQVDTVNYDKVAELQLKMADSWATEDAYDFQWDVTEARVGDFHGKEIEDAESIISKFKDTSGDMQALASLLFKPKVAPSIDQKTYLRLQGMAQAQFPPDVATSMHEGFAAVHYLLKPEKGWDKESGEAMLQASQSLTGWASRQVKANQTITLQQTLEAAQNLAIAARPNASRLNAFIRNDQDRADIDDMKAKGLSEDQIVDGLVTKRFPEWFWKTIESDDNLKKSVVGAIENGMSPETIMFRSRKNWRVRIIPEGGR